MEYENIIARVKECHSWPNAGCLTVAQAEVLTERISALTAEVARLEGELADANSERLMTDEDVMRSIIDRAERAEAERDAAWDVFRLADELTDAIDLATEDIGGHRPIQEILHELGPACDKARAALAPAESKHPAADVKVQKDPWVPEFLQPQAVVEEEA